MTTAWIVLACILGGLALWFGISCLLGVSAGRRIRNGHGRRGGGKK